jgi:hypothetical protein
MGDGREYPLDFWGHYANRVQGGEGLSVDDAYTEWLADKKKEWQNELKALKEATKVSGSEPDWPRMSMADDLTAQLDSLARTNADNYALARQEAEREVRKRQEEERRKGNKKIISRRGLCLQAGMPGRMRSISTGLAISKM